MIYRDTCRYIYFILQRYNDICGALCFERKIGQDDIEASNSQLLKVRIAQNTHIYTFIYIYIHRDRYVKYKRNSNSIVKNILQSNIVDSHGFRFFNIHPQNKDSKYHSRNSG